VTPDPGAADRPARIVLADDHVPTRAGIRLALDGEGFSIVAEVATADEAVAAALRHEPDLCVLDLSMPGGGISAAERILAALPDVKIVMLTVSQDDHDLIEALVAGASGYLLKQASPARLPAALRAVLAGEVALPRSLERRLIEHFRNSELDERRRSGRFPRRRRREPELTPREWEVLDLVRQNLPTPVIARKLGISEVTVRRHLSSAMAKLEVTDRASAVAVIDREGWLDDS
jgi:two-component system nitrate/nitrite response regulator NarL